MNLFDSKRSGARDVIAGASDESLMRTWPVKVGEKTIFSMPRAVVLRSLVLNQIIHHRGQLSVYLRLNDIPVPGCMDHRRTRVTEKFGNVPLADRSFRLIAFIGQRLYYPAGKGPKECRQIST